MYPNAKRVLIIAVIAIFIRSFGFSEPQTSTNTAVTAVGGVSTGEPSSRTTGQKGEQVPITGYQPILFQIFGETGVGPGKGSKSGGGPGVLEFIRDLAWPAVALIALFVVKPILKNLTAIKHGETEFHFGRDKFQKAMENLSARTSSGLQSAAEIESIFESVRSNDWAMLVIARMLLRKGLNDLLNGGVKSSKPPSIMELLKAASDRGVFTQDVRRDLEKLREITHHAEWWVGEAPRAADWKWALANCQRLVQIVYDEKPIT